MTKVIWLFCLTLYCLPIVAQDPCSEVAGVAFGSNGSDERGISVIPTREQDGIYITGTRGNELLLIRQDLSGNTIWARSFDIVPGREDFPTSIVLDNEGMIAICGVGGDKLAGGVVFVFRYNEHTDEILWAQEYASSSTVTCYTMIQKDTGNYVLSTSPIFSNGNIDAELLEINKSTGAFMPAMSKVYSLAHVESLLDITYHDGYIYGTGRYEDGFGLDDLRTTVTKIDPVNGDQKWVRMGHVREDLPARLYGWAIMIDNDSIVTGSYGDPDGSTVTNTEIYLHKSDLDGNVVWCKQFDLSGQTSHFHELLRVADGYVILATTINADQEVILMKTDLNGNLRWAKKFVFEHDINLGMEYFGQRKLTQVAGQLIFSAYGRRNNGDESIIVLKTNADGEVLNGCVESVDFTIPQADIITEYYDVSPTQEQSDPDVSPLSPTYVMPFIAPMLQCSNVDTLFTTLDTAICMGQSFEGYATTGTYMDDFIAVNGCDSIRTLHLSVIGCEEVIHWGLEACESFMHNGSHMDFTEFTPSYPNELNCAGIEADHVDMAPSTMSKHSCTPGVNGSNAMCIGAVASCTYEAGHSNSLIFDISITVPQDSVVQITRFEFYEKAPVMYSWISGPSGSNDYPLFYGILILKNGVEIFREEGISTSQNWNLQQFDFIDHPLFRIEQNSEFRIELLPYCPVGNGAEVSVWDIDEISVFAGCVPLLSNSGISGNVFSKSGALIPNTYLHLSEDASFISRNITKTNDEGQYNFDSLEPGSAYYIKGYKNDHVLQGVSTLDLITMQKHLLGIQPLSSLRQYIAADINHNDAITAVDILQLQKLLLGHYAVFPVNTSWRFGVLPQAFSGTDITLFRESGHLESIQNGTTFIDFEGIKIGDVNEDITLGADNHNLTSRGSHSFSLDMTDKYLTKEEFASIEVRAGKAISLHGFQMEIRCQDLSLVSIESASLDITEENFRFSENGDLIMSWYESMPKSVQHDDVLFRIIFHSNSFGKLSEKLSIQSERIQAEAYIGNTLETHKLHLSFSDPVEPNDLQSFRIAPNPVTHKATLTFNLSESGDTELLFFDVSGRLLHSIRKPYVSGEHSEIIRTDQLFPGHGIIYCKLVHNGFESIQKMVFLR